MNRNVVFKPLMAGLLFILLQPDKAFAGLDDVYRQQKKQAKADNTCAHWNAAKWMATGLVNSSGIGRIRQFSNGDLLLAKISINPSGEFECRNYRYLFETAGRSKMGYQKSIFSDGSGSESTVKIEGNKLVSYESSCMNWKCSRRLVSRHELAIINPERRAIQNEELYKAQSKYKECLEKEGIELISVTRFSGEGSLGCYRHKDLFSIRFKWSND